jgi:hypothetical protein
VCRGKCFTVSSEEEKGKGKKKKRIISPVKVIVYLGIRSLFVGLRVAVIAR